MGHGEGGGAGGSGGVGWEEHFDQHNLVALL